MLQRLLRSTGIAALFAATSMFLAAPAYAQSDQQKLVDASVASLSNFMRDPEMKWLQQNFSRAKAVMIAPEITKASICLLYTSPSPRDRTRSRMPSSA